MKIFITGNSGCGKSFIANKLSKEHNIKICSLDNLVWKNNLKRSYEERENLLNDFLLKNNSWVIEGMSHNNWMHEVYKQADHIFILKTSNFLAKTRIIKRFIKKKLGIEKGHKETLKSLKNLFKIRKEYQENIMPEIIENLKVYNDKTNEVKNYKQIKKIITDFNR